jgi:hypothetical protein
MPHPSKSSAPRPSLVSPVWNRAAAPSMTEHEKDDAARRLWRTGGDMVVLRLSAIRCDIHRQAVINELTRQYGPRPNRGEG